MKFVWLTAALWLAVLVSSTAGGDVAAAPPTLTCDVGPIEKTYGGSKWLVYSCDDGRSVVIISAPGSPAMPFAFRFLARGDAYLLQSQGSGDREFTAKAFGELKGLSAQDVATLVKLTMIVTKKRSFED